MTNVYAITLRTKDGREHTDLVSLPTDEVRQDYYEKARKRGLMIVEH